MNTKHTPGPWRIGDTPSPVTVATLACRYHIRNRRPRMTPISLLRDASLRVRHDSDMSDDQIMAALMTINNAIWYLVRREMR
jgi:hypothetical protein